MDNKFFNEDTSNEQEITGVKDEQNSNNTVEPSDLSVNAEEINTLKSVDEAQAEEPSKPEKMISTAFNLQDYPSAPSVKDDLFSQSEFHSEPEIPEQPEIPAPPVPEFYNDYDEPDFSEGIDDGFEAAEQPEAAQETATQPQIIPEATTPAQTDDLFNPYAPKNAQTFAVQSQVTPGYTNVNSNGPAQQPYQYQQQFYGQQNPGHGRYNPGQPSGNLPEEPNKDKGKLIGGIVLIACLAIAVIGMIAGLMGAGNKDDEQATTLSTTLPTTAGMVIESTAPTTQVPATEAVTTEPVTQVANSIFVADKVRPSVVGVMTYMDGKLYGEGSGVLMSEKDGWTYVVTCAHVIADSGVTYGILLLDGTSLEAELVAYDERTDIGVVKVNRTGLPLAEFGDSSSLKIGEPVYAVGNPGGSEFFGSITNGIVSSIDRSISSTYTMTCIQHNAAINPGNSGGALVNSQGQVIGINSSKIASTDYEGMGFAVPTSIAKPIVDALIQYGYVPNRPKLGIQYAPVSSYQLYSLVVTIKGLPQGSLVIAGISEDSSFANTEVEVGDLIIAVNGKEMTDSSVLLDMVETGAVGDTLTLTLCRIESRTYKTSTFDVTISLVEDKGPSKETTEPTTNYQDGYYYGGSNSFEDFFNDYFGW